MTAIPETQRETAARALAQKQAADPLPLVPQAAEAVAATSDNGMASIPREDYPTSGAFDAEGQRPVLERSRKAR